MPLRLSRVLQRLTPLLFFLSALRISAQPCVTQRPACGTVDTTSYGGRAVTVSMQCQADGLGQVESRDSSATLHGCTVRWYPDGTLGAVEPYYAGKKHGQWQEWYDDGTPSERQFFNHGLPVDTHERWYANGHLESSIQYDSSGQRLLEKAWFPDGERKDSLIYQHGEILEDWHWYPNGKLKFFMKSKEPGVIQSGEFRDLRGKLVGKIKKGNGTVYKFDDDGRLIEKFELKDGVFAF